MIKYSVINVYKQLIANKDLSIGLIYNDFISQIKDLEKELIYFKNDIM